MRTVVAGLERETHALERGRDIFLDSPQRSIVAHADPQDAWSPQVRKRTHAGQLDAEGRVSRANFDKPAAQFLSAWRIDLSQKQQCHVQRVGRDPA